MWCTPLGHCHPQVSRVIAEQAKQMIHTGYCYLHPLINSTAKQILEITGINSGKCVFLCSGSEAVEYSVKLTRSFSDRPLFLTMKNCYLSAYGIAGERSEDNWIHIDWMNDPDIDGIDFTRVAAFVFEPGSSLGLVHFPPKKLVLDIVKRVKENGGIVITNEVTTGMGRTGKWFGHQYYDFVPDVVAAGKGLGNGYPVSCVVIAESVIDKVNLDTFHYAQSHQNDPLGASVAYEVIKIIKEKHLLQRCVNLGNEICQRFNQIKERYGIIKEVRGRGFMIAVEFKENRDCSYAERINSELLKKKIILVKRPGFEIFRIDPPLTIERRDIEYFLDAFEEIIAGM